MPDVPSVQVAAQAGISAEQVERIYRDIEAKRRKTLPLHFPPLKVESVQPIDDRKSFSAVRGGALMCGLAGILPLGNAAPAPSRNDLQRMIQTLRHRGPDSFGFYRDGRIGLAHARLSIIDLAGGDQPLANEDETLWIVFNGEVFNYIELRARS